MSTHAPPVKAKHAVALQPVGAEGGTAESIFVFGKYCEVIQKVSDGSKSVVYLCSNTGRIDSLPPRFAVKRMYFDLQHEAQSLAELELMKPLQCPYIVAVEEGEVARTQGKLCVSLVLEYCPDTLFHIVSKHHRERRTISEDTIWKLLCCIAGALGYLHALSPPIAHRDVKIENILVGSDGNFKLCDFGSATTTAYVCTTSADVTVATRDIALHTTLCYRAPEMADPWQRHRIDEQCDVWALGVVLYFVMHLKFPFEETHLSILNSTVEWPTFSRYSSDLKHVVSSCLVRDPSKRWTIFELIQFLKSTPSGRDFEFPVASRSSDWCAQSTAPQAQNVFTAHPSETSEPTQPFPQEKLSVAPAATNSTNATLFSMLQWDTFKPSPPVEVQPSINAKGPVLPQPARVENTANALDDLFSWDIDTKNDAAVSAPAAGQLDQFFAPQVAVPVKSLTISPSALDHIFGE
ncbi:protein kinase, putative [Bodo saltans]|uniref:non-specific serine/threonine protein kinase n=1 Tax=Bodo saltans TaxID=75058 RepID=A0A0S4IXR9_BODSA|nr:protein kinase, putative [Bodo saltans]|eukprot:CUF96038.1 protein kinase, putative [Bodo saltans]